MKNEPNENELTKLEDDDLIAYAIRCRDSGNRRGFFLAINVFVAGRTPMVRARVGAKVPAADVEDVVGDAIVSAIESISGIKGSTTGEVVNWLKRITQFRIADYYRNRPDEPDLGYSGQEDDDQAWIEPFIEAADEIGEVDLIDAIDRVVADRSDKHRTVIELRMDGYSSKETAEMINEKMSRGLLEQGDEMTNSNVDQIMKRFRDDLRAELDWEPEK